MGGTYKTDSFHVAPFVEEIVFGRLLSCFQ